MSTQDETPMGEQGPEPAAPNRDKRREPVVIDATATESPEIEPAKAASEAAPDVVEAPTPETAPEVAPDIAAGTPVPPPVRAPSRLPLIAAILGGGVLAIGGAAGLHMYMDSDAAIAGLTQQNTAFGARLAEIEKQNAGAADKTALAALDKRLAALEQKPAAAQGILPDALAALEKRLAAAETQARAAASAADSAKADAAKANNLATQVANAASQKPGESDVRPQIVLPPPVDIGPLETRLAQAEQRLATIESAINGAKTEIRATQTESAEAISGATRATIPVIAQALMQNLDRGAPFKAEFAALKKLGIDAARLAALEPSAEKGVPSVRQLALAFAPFAKELARVEQPADSGSLVDRLKQSAAGLVRIRPVGETAGDSTPDIASRIDAALARGDLAAAQNAWKTLPESARKPSAAWAASVDARLRAEAAARAILTDAVERLGQKQN